MHNKKYTSIKSRTYKVFRRNKICSNRLSLSGFADKPTAKPALFEARSFIFVSVIIFAAEFGDSGQVVQNSKCNRGGIFFSEKYGKSKNSVFVKFEVNYFE